VLAMHRWFLAVCMIVVLTGVLTSCKKKKKISVPPRIGATETGIASWYGHPYHGRRAANGEVYDMEKLTAAHRTLAFGTWVRVHNLDNGKRVEVRITDRGPFIRGRIIDLSRAAAREMEMIGPGLAKVRLEVIRAPEISPPYPESYAVQVGSFRVKENAETLRRRMEREFGPARLLRRDTDPEQWRVLVGQESTPERAGELAERIRAAGQDAFVVRLDPSSEARP